MSRSLIVQGRMNYDEAVRRMQYWTEEIRRGNQVSRAVQALAILGTMMARHRDSMFVPPPDSTPITYTDGYKA